MFAGKWLLHVLAAGHYVMIPLAWLPLVLLWIEQTIRGRSVLRATWAGAAFALIVLGTHPQMTFFAGLFIALWSLGCVRALVRARSVSEGPHLPSLTLRARTSSALTLWLGMGTWSAVV